MKFSGTKDLEIELTPDATVRLTMRYATPYEAAVAYDEIRTAAATGKLKITLGVGEVLEEDGPHSALRGGT